MSQAGDVRKILQEGPADFETLAARLDIPKADQQGRKLLRLTLTDLRKVETVAFVDIVPAGSPPQYRLTGRTGARQVQILMGRAVQLKGKQKKTINCKELAALAGCTQEHAGRYLRFLREAGYLLPGEAAKLSRFGLGLAYRVAPGREKEDPPHWSRREEEARKRAADVDKRPTPQETAAAEALSKIQGYLGEMEETLAKVAAGVEQTQENLKQTFRHLKLVKGPESEVEDGAKDHHQP